MTAESKETVDENTKRGASKREFIKTLAGLGLGAAMAQTLYSSLNPKQRAQLVAWAQSYGKPMTYAELGRLIDAAAWDDVVRAVRYQPASYIVYQAPDGRYQAKNGNTGQIEFSGTDAASVIQQAANIIASPLTPDGINVLEMPTIFLKGEIQLSSSILLRHGIRFVGGRLKALGTSPLFTSPAGTVVRHVQFLGIVFDGNGLNVSLISGQIQRCLFSGCIFRNAATGLDIQAGGGVNKIIGCSFNELTQGIILRSTDNYVIMNDIGNLPTGPYAYQQPGILDVGGDNIIANNEIYGWLDGIRVASGASETHLQNNRVHFNGRFGIFLYQTKKLIIEGNSIARNNQLNSANDWEKTGIIVSGDTTFPSLDAFISGNTFFDTTSPPLQVHAVYLSANSQNVRVEGNTILTGDIINLGTNNTVKVNTGFNPRGFAITTPAVPASGTAQANTFPFPVIVYLYGGTVTQITVNGQIVFSSATGISLTGQSFTLNPGDTIAITYTAAPTWKWYGL